MKFTYKTKPANIVLIAACVIIVATSALDTVFHFPGLNFLSEKRTPEKLPDIKRSSKQGISGRPVSLPDHLQSFIAGVVKYYNDNFGLRGILVYLNNAVKVLALKKSPSDLVFIGNKDWLYYTEDANIYYNLHSRTFTAKELGYWNYSLEAKQRWLSRRGIYYLLIIAPDKGTIYPEHLSGLFRKMGSPSLQDQLLQSMSREMRGHVLDLRKTLRTAKNDNQVYCRTDTHWNEEGAYRVYCEIAKKLGERFPLIQPVPRSGFTITNRVQSGGDLAGMLSLSNLITENRPSFMPVKPYQARPVYIGYSAAKTWKPSVLETNNDSLPRAVFMHDSFGGSLQPFLSEHFKRIVYLLKAGSKFSMRFETDEIKQENPDIVIEEFVERSLYIYFPDLPPDILYNNI